MLEAVRQITSEVRRLDAEGVPGLAVRGLGSEHLYTDRLPHSGRWRRLNDVTRGVRAETWRDVLISLGYQLEGLPRRGYLASAEGRPILIVHPYRSAEQFARLDEEGRLPEGALVADCLAHGAPYGVLAADSRMRLLRAGRDDTGVTTRYLELDPAAIDSTHLPLIGLLSPEFLADGAFEAVLTEARDYGSRLRERLDRCIREQVLPVLGRELGRWAKANGRDISDEHVRGDLEAAALTFVFRALFLLYAESAGYLPMANHTYAERSLTRIAARASEELEVADPKATTLWTDIRALVDAMRTGQTAWGVPPYNGDLFAPDGFDGSSVLEVATLPDAALAPALVALARDPEDPEIGVDFSGLEIGHLGHIYEGLLSLRLSVADRDLRYDERKDRYVPASRQDADIARGELLWLTNEGGRKGGGVYYTRTELVRHLVRESVRPAFKAHLAEVRDLARNDARRAAQRLFEFFVLDPACGSAHFLVEVVDELADQIATLVGEFSLPAVRDELQALRATASATFGAEIEDTALLKRLVLKRCVYGVDISPMGAEIAKVSLWLASFVPGLSLAYLDHNIQVGNSLVGVARPESVSPPGAEHGQVTLFGEALADAIAAAARKASELRAIEDRTPAEVEESRETHEALKQKAAAAELLLDLWTAEAFGLTGARDEVLRKGREILSGRESSLGDDAEDLALKHSALHWPLAFAEAFARERPGFDVIVGNPPWEEVNVDELTFFSLFRPGLKAMPESERGEAIDALLQERPDVGELLALERERVAATRAYLGPASGYVAGPGNADLYEFFCQRYRELLRSGGRLGVVLPRSAFSAKGSAAFRSWLFDRAVPTRVDFLLNNRCWMFDTHPQYTVALLAAERRTPDPDQALYVAGVARSVEEFAIQSAATALRLKRAALGPELEIPLVRDQAEADLLGKLRLGRPFPLGCDRWRCFPVQGDFNETADRALWQGATEGRPLWKGESFDQFNPHGAEARWCPASEEALAKARKPRPGSGSLVAKEVPMASRRAAVGRALGGVRVAFRDVTNRTNSRTVISCLVPPQQFLLNSAPYLAFVDGEPNAEAVCLALMNSLVFDWQARRFVETHVNFFILEGLRLPTLDDKIFTDLASAAARLSCLDDRFAEFAAATDSQYGPLTDGERVQLRVEIDAFVARAWGLTAKELDLVFEDFTLEAVPVEYREAVHARFDA
jgi:hypothetical protein